MHLPFYDAKSAAKVECQQTLERFADFDAAGGVGGGGEGGGEGLGGAEAGLPHGGAGGFGGEGAGGVLPAFGEAGVGGGLEVFQQFVGEVGAVADEDDVAAGGEGGAGACFDSAGGGRAFHGEVVGEDNAVKMQGVAQDGFEPVGGVAGGQGVGLGVGDVGGHDGGHALGGEGGEGADVGLEFGDAAGVLGQGVVAVAFDAAVAGEVFATGFHAALGEAAL